MARFGGHVTYKPLHLKNPKWKDSWVWTTVSNQALDWLKMMLPYLKLKKQEAIIAIKFQEERSGHRGRGKVPQAEMAKRNYYYRLLKDLK